MTMQDPIADLCTRIRNAQAVNKEFIVLPSSKIKVELAEVLKAEGYSNGFEVIEENNKKFLKLFLKYYKGKPVINMIKRMSRPGLRNYKDKNSLPKVPGFGIAIVTTSKGVMTARNAKSNGVGGEILCIVN